MLTERYLAAKRRLFDKVLSRRLNPMQCRAVFATEGPVLVLAGAGSGKTTVLVNRVCHIIKYGRAYSDESVPADLTEAQVAELERAIELPAEEIEANILPEFIRDPCPPWAMLCITFTNKAAKEIRERLDTAFDDPTISEEIWAGTFHKVCLRILRRFCAEAGYKPGFTVYDVDDKRLLLTTIMKDLGIDDKKLPVKSVAAEISRQKDEVRGPEDFEPGADPRLRDIGRVYAEYQRRLVAYNAMDFDDIIMQTVRLLENCEEARTLCQNRFRYVSVDEYQDTNVAQFRLTQLLSGGRRNIMVVGDDDQSIYRFRGATVENILSFDRVYEDCTVVKLEQNYRSTRTILDAANAVIAHNRDRHSKTLWCAAGAGERISLCECADQFDEARMITDAVTRGVVKEKRRYRDFAVLYRVNEMGRALESAFAKSGLPYRVLGTQRFYDRREIKDILSYLCVICNPGDTGRLKRIVNTPKRKLGQASLDAAETIAEGTGATLFEVMEHAGDYPALGRCADGMRDFCRLIRSFDPAAVGISSLIEEVFVRTGYKDMLIEEGDASKTRIQSVEEFVSAAVEYENRTGDEGDLNGFLEEIELVSDVDKYDENADAVVLMTVHSAKGLEFPVVFLPGWEEGVFPGIQAIDDPAEMSEERRLAYVALTRAKEKVYISCVRERLLYGRTQNSPLSRFAAREIPAELIDRRQSRPAFAPPRTFYGRHGYDSHGLFRSPREEDEDGGGYRRAPYRQPTRPIDTRKAPVSDRVYVPPMGGGMAPSRAAPGSAAQDNPWGLEKFGVGARVRHDVFGRGEVKSVRDLGGDVLYEVAFDDGSVKKLMATYAKLTRDEGEGEDA